MCNQNLLNYPENSDLSRGWLLYPSFEQLAQEVTLGTNRKIETETIHIKRTSTTFEMGTNVRWHVEKLSP